MSEGNKVPTGDNDAGTMRSRYRTKAGERLYPSLHVANNEIPEYTKLRKHSHLSLTSLQLLLRRLEVFNSAIRALLTASYVSG